MASIFNDNEKLRQYLDGTASDEVRAEVQAWLAENPSHQAQLDEVAALWEAAPKSAYYAEIDAQADWQQVRQRIGAPGDSDAAPESNMAAPGSLGRSGAQRRIWAVAAAVVLLAVVSLIFLRPGGTKQELFETFAEEKMRELPDGSVVTLRPHSRLRYPTEFAGAYRHVELEAGSAFFDVAHDRAHPFRIGAGESQIEVKGTSFTVAREGKATSVSVRTGIVEFTSGKEGVYLRRGERAVMRGTPGDFRTMRNSTNEFSWKSDTLQFEAAPLSQVARDIAHHFSTTVETAPRLDSLQTFTSQFVRPSLDEVLSEMRIVLGLKVRRTKDKIILE